MNSSLDAVGGAETATERLQLELKQLRRELNSCSTRLHLTEKLLAHVQDAVFVAEFDGRIIDVNPAACSLLGYELANFGYRYRTNATFTWGIPLPAATSANAF